jgi:signal transduction protein with GAF and PtsI domain
MSTPSSSRTSEAAVQTDRAFLDALAHLLRDDLEWDRALARILERFGADSGTIHLLEDDGLLHLKSASAGIPAVVLDTVRTVPVGKGMAGLAVERREPVNACNLQTDASGDVRPGARATGLQGSIVVPILRGSEAIGALGIANRSERTFTDDEAAALLEVGKVLARA